MIAAYRSQADAEAGFRQLKDRDVVSFSPMFHWTEQKIRVHVFYCVLALTIAHLMRRQAAHDGLHLSVRELLHTLGGIEETVMIFPSASGRPKARRMLTDRDPTQQHLFDLFGLARYAPPRLGHTTSRPQTSPQPAQTPKVIKKARKLGLGISESCPRNWMAAPTSRRSRKRA